MGKQSNAEQQEDRCRCYNVLAEYKKTHDILTGKKLDRTLCSLKHHEEGLLSRLRGVLFSPEGEELPGPVPAREVWENGMTFLSKQHLKPDQTLVIRICFGVQTPLSTTINVQGKVVSCRPGKGRYPWKIEVKFVTLTRKAVQVLQDAERYMPGN